MWGLHVHILAYVDCREKVNAFAISQPRFFASLAQA